MRKKCVNSWQTHYEIMRLHGGNENVDKGGFIHIMSNYIKSRQSKKRFFLRFTWMNML